MLQTQGNLSDASVLMKSRKYQRMVDDYQSWISRNRQLSHGKVIVILHISYKRIVYNVPQLRSAMCNETVGLAMINGWRVAN
jgi:hypothetical protein